MGCEGSCVVVLGYLVLKFLCFKFPTQQFGRYWLHIIDGIIAAALLGEFGPGLEVHVVPIVRPPPASLKLLSLRYNDYYDLLDALSPPNTYAIVRVSVGTTSPHIPLSLQ